MHHLRELARIKDGDIFKLSQRQQVFIATYNAVCPRLFRSSQEFVVAGIVRNNLNQVLRCDFQTVGCSVENIA
jgi:hypothetical protein